MSFININNPLKREQIVKDYIKSRHEFRIQSENEKAEGLAQKLELEKTYSPLIQATKESTKAITKELQTTRNLSENEKGYWKPDYAKPAIDYYSNLRKNIDKNFSIQKIDDHYQMGEEIIIIAYCMI